MNLSDMQAYEIECNGDENAVAALIELRELRAENAKLVAALEPVFGLTTAISMLLPAIRANDVEQVNMLISLIAGADSVIEDALASVKVRQ